MRPNRRRISNFGGNVSFVPAAVYWPRTPEEVRDCMDRHPGERMRGIGAGHSWNEIFTTDGVLVDLRCLRSVQIEAGQRVRVGAGCTLRRLLRHLRRAGRTLPTLGAIRKQTVAGAVATGTHGSGRQSLSHFVEEARVVCFNPATGKAQIKTFDRAPELQAARCSLGALGVVVEVVLRTVDAYRIEERVDKVGSIGEALAGLEGREPWDLQEFALLPWSWKYVVYRRRATKKRSPWLRARILRCASFWLNDVGLHAILKGLLLYARVSKYLHLIGLTALTGEAAIRGFYRHVAPRLVLGFERTDESTAILTRRHDLFRHVEMELFVRESALPKAIALIQEIAAIAADGPARRPEIVAALAPELQNEIMKLRGSYTLHYVLYFRRVLEDDTLVSMTSPGAHGERAWYSISFFTYRKVDEAHARFARTMALCLMELYGARLHWGKYLPLPLEKVASAYPRFDQFAAICRHHDPKRQFWY
jgi:FAD/FMN-containing dehydrogenase